MPNYHPRNNRKPRGAFRRRKRKQAPIPPKPCVVRYLPADTLMQYFPNVKQLFVLDDGSYKEFPSKSEAQKAIWHTVQASGVPMSHKDYQIEEL